MMIPAENSHYIFLDILKIFQAKTASFHLIRTFCPLFFIYVSGFLYVYKYICYIFGTYICIIFYSFYLFTSNTTCTN